MKKIIGFASFILILFFIFFSILPILWMISSSLKPAGEIYSMPPQFGLTSLTFEHYKYVLFDTHMLRYFWNSIIVAGLTTLFSLGIAVLGGYGFARFKFKGKSIFSVAILFSQMLPLAVLLVPLYMLLSRMNLLDTYPGLILTYLMFTIPLTTWLIRGFLASIPRELEEVAMVDGCTRFQALLRVVIPVSTPAIFATGIYSFIVAWQEFLFALSFTNSKSVRTVPIGIANFIGQYGVNWGAIMAASVMVSLPVVFLFIIFFKQFISTFTEGMMKG